MIRKMDMENIDGQMGPNMKDSSKMIWKKDKEQLGIKMEK